MEVTLDIRIENIVNQAINNAVQKEIAQTVKSFNIEEKLENAANKKAKTLFAKYEQDGRIAQLVAKEIAKTIDINQILDRIDYAKLQELIAEKVSKELVSSMHKPKEQKYSTAYAIIT